MAKFTVTFKEIHTGEIEVEADNAEEAKSKVNEMLEEGTELTEDGAWPSEYSHTLDPRRVGSGKGVMMAREQIRFGLVSAYSKHFDEATLAADISEMHSREMRVISAEPDADGLTLFFSDHEAAALLKAMRNVICGGGWDDGFTQEGWESFGVNSLRVIDDIFFEDDHENLFATWQVEVDDIETALAEMAVAEITSPEPGLMFDAKEREG